MSTGIHRLTVAVCALSWFLLGMHSPIFHEMIDHGEMPSWPVLILVALFAVVGVGSLWALWRLRTPMTAPATPGPRAT